MKKESKPILSEDERLILSEMWDNYIEKKKIKFHYTNAEDLVGKSGAQYALDKLINKDLIKLNKNTYEINYLKENQIREIFKKLKEKDLELDKEHKRQWNIWEKVPNFVIIFLTIILVITIIFTFSFTGRLQMAGSSCAVKDRYNCTEVITKCYDWYNKSDTQIAINICLENNGTYP